MSAQQVRETRIKNAMSLTLSARLEGNQVWTLQKYAMACKCTEKSAKMFLDRLIRLGYVQKSAKGYAYIKAIPSKSMAKTAKVIAANMNKNVYIKSKSIGELFTTEELIAECKRRNIELMV